MINSRMLLMSLALTLLLIGGAAIIMAMPGRLLSADSAPVSPVTPEANNTGASSGGPNTPVSADGNAAPASTTPGAQAAKATPTNSPDDHNLYCPKQSELFKKEMFWYGPNNWRDYSASFVNNINNFAGAQWVGVNVGKIICLYKGVEENNFPVAIERDNLMKKPVGEHWIADPSGYQICKSDNITDCPFSPQAVKSNENVYDFLKDIKK